MIDQDKMRALVASLRKYTGTGFVVDDVSAAADAIDFLLAEVEAKNSELTNSYAEIDRRKMQFLSFFEEATDEIAKLRAELETAAADKRDAERYRALRDFGKDGVKMKPPIEHVHAMIYSHLVGAVPASRVVTGDELDRAIDDALSQRQEEVS